MDILVYNTLPPAKYTLWQDLLHRLDLSCQETVEQTVLIMEADQLIATGSRTKNLLKYIAVDPAWQGQNLTATVLTYLRQAALQAGYRRLFLYTKPANADMFTPLFFYPVAQTSNVLLMENTANGIQQFLHTLTRMPTQGVIGAVVMNCDPFTQGHRYLVQTAASECDWLYVFVLSEDSGFFSAQDRMQMVKLGTADLSNVTVLPTGDYLISAATFPTYFLKNRDQAATAQCQLDIAIFTQHFAPHFGITHRYVGSEPLSALTDMYNQQLFAQLPQQGIRVQQIPRLCHNGNPISASAVRDLLQKGYWDRLQPLVPPSTFSYMQEVML